MLRIGLCATLVAVTRARGGHAVRARAVGLGSGLARYCVHVSIMSDERAVVKGCLDISGAEVTHQ